MGLEVQSCIGVVQCLMWQFPSRVPTAGTPALLPSQLPGSSGVTAPKDAAVSSEFPAAGSAGESSLPAYVCSKSC